MGAIGLFTMPGALGLGSGVFEDVRLAITFTKDKAWRFAGSGDVAGLRKLLAACSPTAKQVLCRGLVEDIFMGRVSFHESVLEMLLDKTEVGVDVLRLCDATSRNKALGDGVSMYFFSRLNSDYQRLVVFMLSNENVLRELAQGSFPLPVNFMPPVDALNAAVCRLCHRHNGTSLIDLLNQVCKWQQVFDRGISSPSMKTLCRDFRQNFSLARVLDVAIAAKAYDCIQDLLRNDDVVKNFGKGLQLCAGTLVRKAVGTGSTEVVSAVCRNASRLAWKVESGDAAGALRTALESGRVELVASTCVELSRVMDKDATTSLPVEVVMDVFRFLTNDTHAHLLPLESDSSHSDGSYHWDRGLEYDLAGALAFLFNTGGKEVIEAAGVWTHRTNLVADDVRLLLTAAMTLPRADKHLLDRVQAAFESHPGEAAPCMSNTCTKCYLRRMLLAYREEWMIVHNKSFLLRAKAVLADRSRPKLTYQDWCDLIVWAVGQGFSPLNVECLVDYVDREFRPSAISELSSELAGTGAGTGPGAGVSLTANSAALLAATMQASPDMVDMFAARPSIDWKHLGPSALVSLVLYAPSGLWTKSKNLLGRTSMVSRRYYENCQAVLRCVSKHTGVK
jgi:hypothetical protein